MEKEKSEKEKRLDKAIRLLTILCSNDFYGKVMLSLEAGNIVNIQETKSYKP